MKLWHQSYDSDAFELTEQKKSLEQAIGVNVIKQGTSQAAEHGNDICIESINF